MLEPQPHPGDLSELDLNADEPPVLPEPDALPSTGNRPRSDAFSFKTVEDAEEEWGFNIPVDVEEKGAAPVV